jgi:hypothetical protein
VKIAPFGIEQWMNEYETRCTYNLAETCVDSLTIAQLLELAGHDGGLLDELLPMKLTLVEPGDPVISVMPTYQQHYSIPESIGADVRILHLREQNAWLPDLDEPAALADGGAKLVVINNPNNPTGSLMDRAFLEQVAAICDRAGAWAGPSRPPASSAS